MMLKCMNENSIHVLNLVKYLEKLMDITRKRTRKENRTEEK